MSIKLFNGIGAFDGTIGVDPASTSDLSDGTTVVVKRISTPVLGNQAFPSRPITPLPPPAVAPTVTPEKFSRSSGYAPHDTIFHEFDLDVFPVYNFWTADEETNESEERGDRALDDIPRYNRIVWNPAPDLLDPTKTRATDGTKQVNRKPVQFSTEIDKGMSVSQKGISFDPEHLKNFDVVKGALANFYVSPGVISAVAELPLDRTNLQDIVPKDESIHYIDEDSFLTNPATAGVSIHELKANVHTMTNGVTNSAAIVATSMSADISAERAVLFDGQFSVERPTENGGMLRVNAAAAGSPGISFGARTPFSSEPALSDQVADLVDKIQESPASQDVDRSAQIKIKFVNPSIGGIVAKQKVDQLAAPEHAENMVAIAQVLPNLEVLSKSGLSSTPRPITIPSFPSPANMKPLEYVGYVIEKYKKNKSGVFQLVDTISVTSREYSEYVDTKVVYSGVYRYRIKAIIRWTRPNEVGPEGQIPYGMLALSTTARSTAFYQSSYFSSEWSKNWAYGVIVDMFAPQPPDELQVRPDSVKGKVTVTFKLPYNPKRDIYFLRLFRKLVDQDGLDVTGWQQVGPNYGPQNVYFEDHDVDFFQKNGGMRYVYAAQTVSRHWEYSSLSEQIAVRFNAAVATYGEYPVEQLSQPGVRLEQHGNFSVRPFRRFTGEIIVPEQFTISGRDALGTRSMSSNIYFVRVESLDTGEKKDYQLNVTYNFQPTYVRKLPLNVFIPLNTKSSSQKKGVSVDQSQNQGSGGDKELTTVSVVASRRNQLPGGIT